MPRLAGVRIACDVGTARIGLAVSDPLGILASPLPAVPGGSGSAQAVASAAEEVGAVEILVGLPLSLSGAEGPAAASVRVWAAELSAATSIPIRLADERLTTVQAQRGMRAAGRSVRDSRSMIDSAAAVVLLQSDLDSGTP